MSGFAFGGTQPTPAFGGFSFGSTSTSAPNLTAPTMTTALANPLGGTSTLFGGLGTTPASTTSSLFAPATSTFSTSIFPTATTASTFPTLGQAAPTAQAPSSGFTFGGFGAPASSAPVFGAGTLSTVSSVAPTSTAPSNIGLGGVDIQTSTGLNGSNATGKRDNKVVKENPIPNEIIVAVEALKKYIKEQKAIREEMSRVSNKSIYRVQEQVAALRQQLCLVSNGLQQNAKAIVKLKEESNQELKNAEIAQRTKDAPSSSQYENNAPIEYFHNLASLFERQMQSYRQQIEQLERHLLSLSQPYTLTPNEWTDIRRRFHDTFVTLAAQLQTVHQQVQVCREHFINTHRQNNNDVRSLFETRKVSDKDPTTNLNRSIASTYGPSPFATMQSAVGKAITNVFNRTQLPGGGTALGGLMSLGFEKTAIGEGYSLFSSSYQLSSMSFKTLGDPVPFLSSSSLGDSTGFAGDISAQSQFGLSSQKPFQLQKPPAGNKRGKRWTSS